MILPIVAYGADVLRKVSKEISADYPDFPRLIEDMWETMYASSGVGLAAPQINRDIRLFIIDSAQLFAQMNEEETLGYPDAPGCKKVFVNAKIISLDGNLWAYNEGCLSIPRIRDDVYRHESVTLQYMDEQFNTHTDTFNGITARVILHEYDHIEGKLFIDYMKPLKKKLIRGKLDDITKGKISVDYRMSFPK
jgi:peptide deformylase